MCPRGREGPSRNCCTRWWPVSVLASAPAPLLQTRTCGRFAERWSAQIRASWGSGGCRWGFLSCRRASLLVFNTQRGPVSATGRTCLGEAAGAEDRALRNAVPPTAPAPGLWVLHAYAGRDTGVLGPEKAQEGHGSQTRSTSAAGEVPGEPRMTKPSPRTPTAVCALTPARRKPPPHPSPATGGVLSGPPTALRLSVGLPTGRMKRLALKQPPESVTGTQAGRFQGRLPLRVSVAVTFPGMWQSPCVGAVGRDRPPLPGSSGLGGPR